MWPMISISRCRRRNVVVIALSPASMEWKVCECEWVGENACVSVCLASGRVESTSEYTHSSKHPIKASETSWNPCFITPVPAFLSPALLRVFFDAANSVSPIMRLGE